MHRGSGCMYTLLTELHAQAVLLDCANAQPQNWFCCERGPKTLRRLVDNGLRHIPLESCVAGTCRAMKCISKALLFMKKVAAISGSFLQGFTERSPPETWLGLLCQSKQHGWPNLSTSIKIVGAEVEIKEHHCKEMQDGSDWFCGSMPTRHTS